MTVNRDRRYLEYIRDSITLIEARTQPGRDAFFQNVDVQDAVMWRLETLAEAAGKLSPDLRDRHPDVPWRAIYGFRNIAAHTYLELRLEQVWEIVTQHLPVLRSVVVGELTEPTGQSILSFSSNSRSAAGTTETPLRV